MGCVRGHRWGTRRSTRAGISLRSSCLTIRRTPFTALGAKVKRLARADHVARALAERTPAWFVDQFENLANERLIAGNRKKSSSSVSRQTRS